MKKLMHISAIIASIVIMLVVTAIPHHHHGARMCVSADQTETFDANASNSSDSSQGSDNCPIKVLRSGNGLKANLPLLIVALTAILSVEHLVIRTPQTGAFYYHISAVSIYTAHISKSHSLRAPPVLV